VKNLNNLIDLLVKHEGLRTKPYEDTTGHLSIGVGRNLDSLGLSHDEIYYMLKNDIRRCMETDDFEEAADEFLDSLWATQVGQRAVEITYMIRYGEYYA